MTAARILGVVLVAVACMGSTCDEPTEAEPAPPNITGSPIAGYVAALKNGCPVAENCKPASFDVWHAAGVCLFTSGDYIFTYDVTIYHGSHDPSARSYGKFTTSAIDTLAFFPSTASSSWPLTGRAWFSRDTVRMMDGSYLFVRDSAYAWNSCGILNK